MNNKNIQKLVLATLLISFSLCDNSQYEGCFLLIDGTCTFCHNRKPLGLGKACGAPLPATNKCEVYSYDRKNKFTFCAKCKANYVLNFGAKDPENACQLQDSIPGCTYAAQEMTGGRVGCAACSQQKYALLPDLKKCVPGGTDAVDHCLWGGKLQPGSGADCYRCQPGYALGANFNCHPQTAPGCLINGGRAKSTCFACDAFAGYYMVPGNRCVKK